MLVGSSEDKQHQPSYFLGLPPEIWGKIYEYILFDPTLRDKLNFNLVNRYFNNIANNPSSIRRMISELTPVVMDSPQFKEENYLPIMGFLKLLKKCESGIDNIETFIPYLFLYYLNDKAAFIKRVEEFKKLYNILEDHTDLIIRVDRLMERVDELFLTYKSIWRKEFSNEDLRFDKFLTVAIQGSNFRYLMATFSEDRLTSHGITGLQWALAIEDTELFKKFLKEKVERLACQQRNPQLVKPSEKENADLVYELLSLLENKNWEEIKRKLNVSFDKAELKTALNSKKFIERIMDWHYEDIFKKHQANRLHALQVLAGNADFQAAIVVPLARQGRYDLIPLLSMEENIIREIGLESRYVAVFFDLLTQADREVDSMLKATWLNTIEEMIKHPGILQVLHLSPKFLNWAFATKRFDLIKHLEIFEVDTSLKLPGATALPEPIAPLSSLPSSYGLPPITREEAKPGNADYLSNFFGFFSSLRNYMPSITAPLLDGSRKRTHEEKENSEKEENHRAKKRS